MLISIVLHNKHSFTICLHGSSMFLWLSALDLSWFAIDPKWYRLDLQWSIINHDWSSIDPQYINLYLSNHKRISSACAPLPVYSVKHIDI